MSFARDLCEVAQAMNNEEKLLVSGIIHEHFVEGASKRQLSE